MEIKLKYYNGQESITGIDLGSSSPRLSGAVDISTFANLNTFTCTGNDITSISDYTHNVNLINFNVADNKLTGSIPNLSGLPLLTRFYCGSNLLSGGMPDLRSNSDELKDFRCEGNMLKGPIANLDGMSGLENFRCNNNQITGFIPALSGLTNLKDFRCQTNQISGNIPEINNLINLTDFFVGVNKLTGVIPSLNGLSALEDFGCESNLLSGPIPNLSTNINLSTFSCQSNQLTGQIPSLGNNTKLTRFLCHTNQLSGPVPSLDGLTEITQFQCYSNSGLNGRLPDFNNVPKLASYTCTNTSITGLPLNMSGAPELVTFNVFSNPSLSGAIPSLDGLTKLVTFQAYGCNLTGSIPNLSSNTSLATLHLYNNKLTGNIPNLSNNLALGSFQCYNNQLTGYDGGTISPSLNTITLQGNSLTKSAVGSLITSLASGGRNSGTRSLNIGTTNSAPDFTTNVYLISGAGSGVNGFPTATFTRAANSFIATGNITGHNLSQNDIITINGVTSTPANLFNVTTKVNSVINANRFTFTVAASSASTVNNSASTLGRLRKSLASDNVLSSYQKLALPTGLGGLGWTTVIVFP